MTILPDDVILMMTRHNGRIDGDTPANMVGQRELNITYSNTTDWTKCCICLKKTK